MTENKLQITCPNCKTSYRLSPDLLSSGRKAMRCAVCSDTFVARKTGAAPPAPAPEPEERPQESPSAEPFDYDPEESSWDVDPENDPVLGETAVEEEQAEEKQDLKGALSDYDSVDLEDLTFGEDDEDTLEDLTFGRDDEEELDIPDDVELDSDEEIEEGMPEPAVTEAATEAGKIDAADESMTLGGRPVSEWEDRLNSSTEPENEFEDDELEEDDIDEEALAEAGGGVSALASLKQAEQEKEPAPVTPTPVKPMRSSFTKNERAAAPQELEPTSGIIYYALIILIGVGGLATSFVDLGTWQFDPVWSISMIVLGAMGFFLQNLSAIYIAGFYSIFYAFALFSHAHEQLNLGEYSGVIHLGVIFLLAFILSSAYALLIGRRSGHFVLKESSFQSILSFICGLAAIFLAYWSNIVSESIAPLGRWHFLGWPIQSYSYYGSVPLQVIMQAAAASIAVAMGISAHRLRNRLLILAKLAILFGIVVILLLFAPSVVGPLTFNFPV